jgi:adhesin HecA-like repeat protein
MPFKGADRRNQNPYRPASSKLRDDGDGQAKREKRGHRQADRHDPRAWLRRTSVEVHGVDSPLARHGMVEVSMFSLRLRGGGLANQHGVLAGDGVKLNATYREPGSNGGP